MRGKMPALATRNVSLSNNFRCVYPADIRYLYHFSVAYNKGKATDPVSYFAAPENQDLRVVKIRKPEVPLNLSPFPKTPLTFVPSS